MQVALQGRPHQEDELFFVRATLTQPVALNGRLETFTEDCKSALSSRRPLSARNWSVQLETPARCVIRTILSAPSEQEATQHVLGAIKVAFRESEVQPGRVAVKAPSHHAEISYSQSQSPGPA
jgi:hypothetical protein